MNFKFFLIEIIFFKFKIQNFTKTKQISSYIHPRNIPNDFEFFSNIGCRVTDVDRQTDRPDRRPTTRHGNRSSGHKNYVNQTTLREVMRFLSQNLTKISL